MDNNIFDLNNSYNLNEKSIKEIINISKQVLPNKNYSFVYIYNSINKLLENDLNNGNNNSNNRIYQNYINNQENYLETLKICRNIDNINFRLTLDYIFFITFLVSNIEKIKESRLEWSKIRILLEKVNNSYIPYLITSISVLYSNSHIFYYNINHLKLYIEEILRSNH